MWAVATVAAAALNGRRLYVGGVVLMTSLPAGANDLHDTRNIQARRHCAINGYFSRLNIASYEYIL